MRIKKVSLMFLGAAAGFVFFVLTAEMIFRAGGRYRLIRSSGETEGHSWLNKSSKYKISDDIKLRWEIDVSNIKSESYAGHKVNELGFFDKPRRISKDPGTCRIIIIGDSITQNGWYVDILEKALNTKAYGKWKDVEVWNCGVGGYSAEQFDALLRKKIISFKPDMVILAMCIDEFADIPIILKNAAGRVVAYENDIGFMKMPVSAFLFSHSYAYRAFLFTVKDILNGLRRQRTHNSAAREALLDIIAESKKRDIPFMILVFPLLKEEYNETERAYRRELMDLLNETGVKYLDMHGRYKNTGDISWRLSEDDYIHPSENGHKVIARELFEFLDSDPMWWAGKESSAGSVKVDLK